jgi:hypothetical protein
MKSKQQKITQVQLLDLEQLHSIVGGQLYKVPDVTLKRGVVG